MYVIYYIVWIISMTKQSIDSKFLVYTHAASLKALSQV